MTHLIEGDLHRELRAGVRSLSDRFSSEYWQRHDQERAYPQEFVTALTDAGWLSILIPEEYGGGGLGLSEASIVLEEINASGGSSAACHAQMYLMSAILLHGSDEQKKKYLREIATGNLRLQSFAVTEPDAGSDTTSITTTAVRQGSSYVINGKKIFTSRVQHSDLMLLLARTAPRSEKKKTAGLSLFVVDLREAGDSVECRPIRTMLNHETNEVFITDLKLDESQLLGEEGRGFKYVLDGMNAERILLASECIGDGRWFCRKASTYAGEREVFGRPIGQNQGVQFPIARAFAAVEAADLMRRVAAHSFDRGEPCGDKANLAKLLASEAAWEAANACLDTFGGFGFAEEFDVERKFRETRLYKTAPIANNLVLAHIAHHVLGMPRSY